MPTTLTTRAIEQSTFALAVTFTDEAGAAVIPNDIAWSLLDKDGLVVNGQNGIVLPPAASVTILLAGDDLKSSEGSTRVVLIEGSYDSDLGTDLPLRDTVTFQIANLIGVS